MDGIILAILTVLGAVISAAITILVKNYKDRKIKRVNPTFKIGNDEVEDIDLKLKNINDYWIYDLNYVDDLVNKEHYYFYFIVLKNYYLFDCKITYQVTFTDDTKLPEEPKYSAIGTLFPHKGYMLPIEKTGRETSIKIILKFKNENNENIKFILVAEIDSNKKWFKTVTETSYRVKGNDEKNERLKEITCFSRNMSNINSAKAISIKLNGRTLNKTEIDNGNNNTSQSA
jgi:hypothetical protein